MLLFGGVGNRLPETLESWPAEPNREPRDEGAEPWEDLGPEEARDDCLGPGATEPRDDCLGPGATEPRDDCLMDGWLGRLFRFRDITGLLEPLGIAW